MANFVFNTAKGRTVEFYNRVENNDPAASAFIVIPLETTGLETQANLEDSISVTELLDGATNEQTTMGRKTLTDADLAALPIADTTNNRYSLDLPDITWTAAAGNAISALVVCYDNDTGAGTDANIIPLTYHDFITTPTGTDIVATTTEFFRAS
jgi:hypothetical protein